MRWKEAEMDEINGLKAGITAVFSFIVAILGVLYIPVLLMVACNIIDYITGLMAVSSRKDELSSYRSIKGIMKKVCMWLLVVVGAIVDELIKYASQTVGIDIPVKFLIGCVVAIWIICSELISILENIIDIGVPLPPFLMPLIHMIQKKTEEAIHENDKSEADIIQPGKKKTD